MCENHANVAEDIPSGISVICLYAKASLYLTLLCHWWPLLGQEGGGTEQKQRFIRDLYSSVTGGVGVSALLLNLFQAKVKLID